MSEKSEHLFFLGIGGIGMSALARYYHQSGYKVSGYDRDKTALTKKLEELGISIQYEFNSSLLEDSIDLVIYTPAIKSDQQEFQYFLDKGTRMLKRSEALMQELGAKKVIAVAGTHGKTTTGAMLAHILCHNSFGATAFIGGVMRNYDSNFLFGESHWVIVEADEYDRSFWRLFPDIAIIQAIDADHLDIYGTEEEMVDAYRVFTLQIKKGGHLFVEDRIMKQRIKGIWKTSLEANEIECSTFGLYGGDLSISWLEESEGMSRFVLNDSVTIFDLSLAGAHNVQNVMGAIAVARHLGISDENIAEAIKCFRGIERRFEYVFRDESSVIIDDYAHHPREIDAAISAARKHHPARRLTVVFQPHLYSRTRDFIKDFAGSLGEADELILVELYPAREQPIKGINSERLLSLIEVEDKAFVPKKKLVKYLGEFKRPLILLLGAGDVYKLIDAIKVEYSK